MQALFSRGIESKTLAVPVCLPWDTQDPGRVIETDEWVTGAGWGITGTSRSQTMLLLCNIVQMILEIAAKLTNNGHTLIVAVKICTALHPTQRVNSHITEYNRTVFTEQQDKFSGASTDTLQGADLQLVSAEDCRPLVREGLNLDLPRSTFCTSSRNGEDGVQMIVETKLFMCICEH